MNGIESQSAMQTVQKESLAKTAQLKVVWKTSGGIPITLRSCSGLSGPVTDDVESLLLHLEHTRLGLLRGFDQLLCLEGLTGVEQLPHQIETVRKVLRHFRGRVLLADSHRRFISKQCFEPNTRFKSWLENFSTKWTDDSGATGGGCENTTMPYYGKAITRSLEAKPKPTQRSKRPGRDP